MCSSSAADRPVRRPRSPWLAPGRDGDRRRQGHVPPRQDLRRRPHHRCPAPARGARPRADGGAVVAARSTTSWSARRPGREVTFPLPAGPGRVRRGRPPDRPRRRAPRRRPRRRRRGARRRARSPAPTTAPTASSSTLDDGIGAVRARYVVAADGMWSPLRKLARRRRRPATGRVARLPPVLHRCRPARRRGSCSSGSSPTCCPATPGRSRCPAAGPTSGSASSAAAKVPTQDMKALWPELLRPAAHRRACSGPTPRPSRPTGPGRSRPASTTSPLTAGRDALRRRRRRRHRPDDRRGHRPGAAHRHPRGRGDRRTAGSTARPGAAARYERDVRRALRRRPPHVDAADPGPQAPQGRPGRASAIAGATAWTRRNFARWLFEDYPRAIVLTPRRWHRQFLRPGDPAPYRVRRLTPTAAPPDPAVKATSTMPACARD